MNDKFREECGIFGIFGHPEAANLTYLGLYALQHRGQESVGISTSDGLRLRAHKSMGYVADAFDEAVLEKLAGTSAIGHVRYSTAGESGLKNAQPIQIECTHGEIAIGHNGNLVNADELRTALVQSGSIFQTTSDTEVLLHLYARSKAGTPDAALVEAISQAQGAAHCIFEHVYFARPDSYVFGESVNEVRTAFGRQLAAEQPVDADVVVPIPDSGVCAATGFASASNIPLQMGLIRNHYVGRTFIEPQQSIRHFGVRVKLNPVKSILAGRRVVLVDDSIVRGTTSRKIVKMVRAAGATEVHMRISCPPTISPCFYGVDTPQRSELIAATHTLEEVRKYIGADSLGYLSLDGLLSAVGSQRKSYCTSCYTGEYPVAFPQNQAAYLQLALKLAT
jgi:glutamine phosphoribosylpyrophosphate amidotransferase